MLRDLQSQNIKIKSKGKTLRHGKPLKHTELLKLAYIFDNNFSQCQWIKYTK